MGENFILSTTSFITDPITLIWVLLIVLFAMLIFKIKICGPGKWNDDCLSLSVSKGLQGFCAVLIILHHISQALEDAAGPLKIFENLGVCFVGIFFFFSGYGLLYSLNHKSDYLHHFFRKRLPVILIPFYIIILLFMIVYSILGADFQGNELLCYFTGWWLVNSHMWYIVEIFFLYLIFFFVFRFIRNRAAQLTVMGVLTALIVVGSLLLGHGDFWFQGEWWFNTTFLFFIGMLIAQFEQPLSAFVKRFYFVIIGLVAILFLVFHHATDYMLTTYSYWSETEISMAYGDKFRCLSVQLPFVICFVLFLILLTMKVQLKNRILSFLGSISLELYLVHNLFLQLFIDTYTIENAFLCTVAILVCSIILATILHLIDQKLIKFARKIIDK